MSDVLPDARTRFVGLLGEPVRHSLSPLIHNEAFRAAGVNAVYLAMSVASKQLSEAVSGLQVLGALGANVTIPHKRAVIAHLDNLTPEAEAIGAVNTIVCEADGSLRGDNTDAAGFLHGFGTDQGARLKGKPALVLGAGGAARAVAYALLTVLHSEPLTLAVRHPAQAEALAVDLAALDLNGALRVVSLADAGPMLRSSRLVVNATPLGMHPDTDVTPWPDASDFGPVHTVYDLVYTPSETRLLRDAARQGARTISGLAMLVGQAAASFVQWTGTPMPLDAVYAALHDHLDS